MKEFRFKWLMLAFAVCLVFGLSSPVIAAGGNGFPEGDHYNLNLIAKKSVPTEPGFFTCPDAAKYQWDYYKTNPLLPDPPCTEDAGVLSGNCVKCTPDFKLGVLGGCDLRVASEQNVIFVPRSSGETVSILVQSGSARTTKKTTMAPSLKVTDWCSETFDDDEAVFQLPENRNGYRVYARVTGKPLPGTAWEFMTPEIKLVQDEYGNNLYWLGTIGGANGCTDSAGNILARIDPTRKGKGVKTATDLSCMFNFTGDVCYVNDLCFYCPTTDPCSNATTPLPGVVCCEKSVPVTLDGCGVPANYACENTAALNCMGWDSSDPPVCIGGWELVCPEENQVLVALQCHSYADTWVFDIADFVDVLWKGKQGNEEEPEGAYVVQLRFYKN